MGESEVKIAHIKSKKALSYCLRAVKNANLPVDSFIPRMNNVVKVPSQPVENPKVAIFKTKFGMKYIKI